MTAKSVKLDKDALFKYRRAIYDKIDDLILQQRQFVGEDKLPTDIDEFYRIEEEIRRYHDIVIKSSDISMLKICANELLYANQSHDNRRSDEMKDYVMITVNPMDSVPLTHLINAVHNFMKSAFVEWGIYVFEQKSSDSNWHGWHSHILFKRRNKPSVVKDGIKRILRPLAGNDKANKVKSQSELKEVINYVGYLHGRKKDAHKLPVFHQSDEWRRSVGLESVYTVGTIPSLVGMVPNSSVTSDFSESSKSSNIVLRLKKTI